MRAAELPMLSIPESSRLRGETEKLVTLPIDRLVPISADGRVALKYTGPQNGTSTEAAGDARVSSPARRADLIIMASGDNVFDQESFNAAVRKAKAQSKDRLETLGNLFGLSASILSQWMDVEEGDTFIVGNNLDVDQNIRIVVLEVNPTSVDLIITYPRFEMRDASTPGEPRPSKASRSSRPRVHRHS